jgi:glycosyltransferase involved in cell wall biosynthesis
MRLSVAIVCKNSADTIGRTLESVKGLADEIVAVDSGSTDATLDLLTKADATIIESDWLGYVKTKQLALEACSGEWVLALDSDESLLPDLADAIKYALGDPKNHTGFALNRKVFVNSKPLNHAWQPESRLRLVKQSLYHWQGLDPHDHLMPINPAEPISTLAGDLRHDSVSTWPEFIEKQARHAEVMAASMLADGRTPSRFKLLTSPAAAYLKQILLRRAFLDGKDGFIAAKATAKATKLKHLALFRLYKQANQSEHAQPR